MITGCSTPPPVATPRPALVAVAQAPDVQTTVVSGEVRSMASLQVAAEYGGRVVDLTARVGDRVAAGQVLARLDASTASLQLSQARAGLDVARVDLEAARREAGRLKVLVDAGAASPQELDNAASAAQRAEALQQSAAAQVRLAERTVEKGVIRAPVAGVIAARTAELGAFLPPGATVFALDAPGESEILAAVPLAQAHRLAEGDRVAFRAGPATGTAVVTGVAQRVTGVGSAALRLRIESGAPPPGSSVQLRIPTANPAGLTSVPLSAVLTDRKGARRVLVVGADDRARSAAVELVSVSTAGALVRGGVAPGQRIVAAGGDLIQAGEPVRPLPYTP